MSWAVAQENTMDDEDLMTEEDRNREYLRQHPAQELSLWMDWVQTVCRGRKIAPPTGHEWDTLTASFHHGKMPITSVDELEAMRKQPNTTMTAAPRAVD
jgi:hypothetical protein